MFAKQANCHYAPGSDPQSALEKQAIYHHAPGSDPQSALDKQALYYSEFGRKAMLLAEAHLGLKPPQWSQQPKPKLCSPE